MGIPFTYDGKAFVIMANWTYLIADGEGLARGFNWRGATSLKPCLLHHNVFSRDSDLAHRQEGCVDVTCHNPSLFKRWAANGIETIVDAISAAHEKCQRGEWTKNDSRSCRKSMV